VSNNYIQSVESDPPPGVPDGGTVVIIHAGLPLPTLPDTTFANRSTNRTVTDVAGGK
jgi:hypothetical protein